MRRSRALVFAIVATAPLPDFADTFFAALFGPLLSVGSYGLYRMLAMERKSAWLQIAAVANIVAGALLTAMLLVQLAVRRARWHRRRSVAKAATGRCRRRA